MIRNMWYYDVNVLQLIMAIFTGFKIWAYAYRDLVVPLVWGCCFLLCCSFPTRWGEKRNVSPCGVTPQYGGDSHKGYIECVFVYTAEMPTGTNSSVLVLIRTSKIMKISTNTNMGGQNLPYLWHQIFMFFSEKYEFWLQSSNFINLNTCTNFCQVRLASLILPLSMRSILLCMYS
jgi:hypothetical protein